MTDRLDQRVKDEVQALSVQGRRPSASYLLWFLINVLRVDPDEAPDFVCDSVNDKGVDGILVDEQAAEVLVFSSKYYTGRSTLTQGDKDIRDLVGAAQWFVSPDSVESLQASTASEELKSLVSRLEVARKIQEGFSVRTAFITSVPFDPEAKEYLALQDLARAPVLAWDPPRVNDTVSGFTRPDRVQGTFSFTILPGGTYDRTMPDGTRVIILPLEADEVASLDGLDDRSLFARNVRLPIGSTRVNRDIRAAIQATQDHSRFILYHNGITILCEDIRVRGRKLTIANYSLVNGCQSVASFYDNKAALKRPHPDPPPI